MKKNRLQGFTLVETMVAIALLMVAIIAPMALTIQSLSSAYYARDEITASNLAQEGIESVIQLVDNNTLTIAEGAGTPDLFTGINAGQWFTIDSRDEEDTFTDPGTPGCKGTILQPGSESGWQFLTECPPLQTDGELYGYSSDWTNTPFTRSLYACYIQPGTTPTTCNGTASDEMQLTVVVTWEEGSLQQQSVVLQENLYKWIAQSAQT